MHCLHRLTARYASVDVQRQFLSRCLLPCLYISGTACMLCVTPPTCPFEKSEHSQKLYTAISRIQATLVLLMYLKPQTLLVVCKEQQVTGHGYHLLAAGMRYAAIPSQAGMGHASVPDPCSAQLPCLHAILAAQLAWQKCKGYNSHPARLRG